MTKGMGIVRTKGKDAHNYRFMYFGYIETTKPDGTKDEFIRIYNPQIYNHDAKAFEDLSISSLTIAWSNVKGHKIYVESQGRSGV